MKIIQGVKDFKYILFDRLNLQRYFPFASYVKYSDRGKNAPLSDSNSQIVDRCGQVSRHDEAEAGDVGVEPGLVEELCIRPAQI